MKKTLIVYGTTEGHTRKVCHAVTESIRMLGRKSELFDSTLIPNDLDISQYDGVIVAASVHQHRYQPSIIHFIKSNRDQLQKASTAFLSVSMSSADNINEKEAQKYVDDMIADCDWKPSHTELVAGALLYTRYDFFKRQIMKLIVRHGGGPTDASKDYEFTDWDRLNKFVKEFVEAIA